MMASSLATSVDGRGFAQPQIALNVGAAYDSVPCAAHADPCIVTATALSAPTCAGSVPTPPRTPRRYEPPIGGVHCVFGE